MPVDLGSRGVGEPAALRPGHIVFDRLKGQPRDSGQLLRAAAPEDHEVRRGEDLVDEALAHRLLGAQRGREEEQFRRARRPQNAVQQPGAAEVTGEAGIDKSGAQRCVGGHVPQVAREGQAEARTDRGAVDERDRRLAQLAQADAGAALHLALRGRPRLGLGDRPEDALAAGEYLHVTAGAEAAACSGQYDDPDRVIALGFVKGLGEGGEHAEREGVARLGPVQFQDHYAGCGVEVDVELSCTSGGHSDPFRAVEADPKPILTSTLRCSVAMINADLKADRRTHIVGSEDRARPAAPPRSAPLAGVTVVSFEQAVSVPYCTRILGDLGARVIKVERPGTGDFARDYDNVANGMSSHFVWLNRNKQSLALDAKSAHGAAVLERLLERADVVVQNLAPGSAARMGIDAETLAAKYPRIIAVDLSGYGTGGPLDHRRAYDLLVQSEAGACAITGEPGSPAKPGPPVADVGAGLQAVVAILSALVARSTTGQGVAIEISMFDTVIDFIGFALLHALYTGTERPPIGLSSPVVSPYGGYLTRDGRTVVLGTTNDNEWQRLAREVISRPDLADDPSLATNAQRCDERARLDEAISAWAATVDAADVLRAADAAAIGNGVYHEMLEVVDHPQLVERDRWQQVDSPVGPLSTVLPPFRSTSWEVPLGPIPGIGEHTDQILAELGLAPEGHVESAEETSR
jgi:itaconate CoA-transferase